MEHTNDGTEPIQCTDENTGNWITETSAHVQAAKSYIDTLIAKFREAELLADGIDSLNEVKKELIEAQRKLKYLEDCAAQQHVDYLKTVAKLVVHTAIKSAQNKANSHNIISAIKEHENRLNNLENRTDSDSVLKRIENVEKDVSKLNSDMEMESRKNQRQSRAGSSVEELIEKSQDDKLKAERVRQKNVPPPVNKDNETYDWNRKDSGISISSMQSFDKPDHELLPHIDEV